MLVEDWGCTVKNEFNEYAVIARVISNSSRYLGQTCLLMRIIKQIEENGTALLESSG